MVLENRLSLTTNHLVSTCICPNFFTVSLMKQQKLIFNSEHCTQVSWWIIKSCHNLERENSCPSEFCVHETNSQPAVPGGRGKTLWPLPGKPGARSLIYSCYIVTNYDTWLLDVVAAFNRWSGAAAPSNLLFCWKPAIQSDPDNTHKQTSPNGRLLSLFMSSTGKAISRWLTTREASTFFPERNGGKVAADWWAEKSVSSLSESELT